MKTLGNVGFYSIMATAATALSVNFSITFALLKWAINKDIEESKKQFPNKSYTAYGFYKKYEETFDAIIKREQGCVAKR